jgi:hypothetical protein
MLAEKKKKAQRDYVEILNKQMRAREKASEDETIRQIKERESIRA